MKNRDHAFVKKLFSVTKTYIHIHFYYFHKHFCTLKEIVINVSLHKGHSIPYS